MKKALFMLALVGLMLPVQAGDLPKWLDGWKVKGDLRLRAESKDSDTEGAERRDRARFRLRISADKKINDQFKVSLRFASGSGDPTSTNQSFDNSFSGKDWNIDRAMLSYKSGNWNIHGGKMKNILHNTDIVWDSDVNPEGFFQNYDNGSFYFTAGELFAEEEKTDYDTNLYVLQFGTKGGDNLKYNVSGSYYSYNEAEGFFGTQGDDYNFVDLVAALKISGVSLKFNYVQNTTSGIDDNDTAYAVFVDWGGKKPGDWKFGLKYAEIEAFSSMTVFADSDFGFGDKEGFKAYAGYQANKFLAWKLSVFSVDSILAEDKGFNYAQLDCAIKF